MTCRSLLWIAATAVSVGAATAHPSIAAAEPDPGWTITIDAPTAGAIVESKHLTIHGTAAHDTGIDGITVTIVPQDLPPQCSPETGPATLEGDRYVIELDVDCNGPHQIQIEAHSAGDTATGDPRTVGVAEPPPRPAPPTTDLTAEGGLWATWDPGHDPDTAGTILIVDYRQDHFGPGIDEATLPPSDRHAAVTIRTLRWGADGPGTTISSPESGGTYIAPDPLIPAPPPSEPSPAAPPPPPAGGPTSTAPRPTRGATTAPSGTGAPSTTSPAGPGEAQPAAATVAAGPEATRWWPRSDGGERAVSTPTGGSGLVRTSDERTPARVAPLALALLIITVAAGIAWRSRRTRPRPWRDRIPPIRRRPDRGALGADLALMAHAWTDPGRVVVGRPPRHRRVASGTGSLRAARGRRGRSRRPRS